MAIIVAIVFSSTILTEESIVPINSSSQKIIPNTSDPASSGPLTILKTKNRLYENVFFNVIGLEKNQKGDILIFAPNDELYQTIPFDGSKKTHFNFYFKPSTSSGLKLCTIEDLVGVWTAKFVGINYKPLQFEIINEFVRGGESGLQDVC